MYEQIRAAVIRLNEAVALRFVVLIHPETVCTVGLFWSIMSC
jgi:hypothetical protein